MRTVVREPVDGEEGMTRRQDFLAHQRCPLANCWGGRNWEPERKWPPRPPPLRPPPPPPPKHPLPPLPQHLPSPLCPPFQFLPLPLMILLLSSLPQRTPRMRNTSSSWMKMAKKDEKSARETIFSKNWLISDLCKGPFNPA